MNWYWYALVALSVVHANWIQKYVVFIFKVVNLLLFPILFRFLQLFLFGYSVKLVNKSNQVVLCVLLRLIIHPLFKFRQSCNNKHAHNLTITLAASLEEKSVRTEGLDSR